MKNKINDTSSGVGFLTPTGSFSSLNQENASPKAIVKGNGLLQITLNLETERSGDEL